MFFVLIVLIVSPSVASDDKQYTALHFGTSSNDYIGFTFNMAPFQDSFSICTWMKRVDSSTSYPIVFNYHQGTNEILIGSNGARNEVVSDYDLDSKNSLFTTPVGSWFNYCITWSLASTSTNLYLDGHLVGTGTTPSGRTLKMGGTLFFNRLSYSTDSHHIFGGQIYQFNIFSEALSSADVKKIAEGGMCMDLKEFSGTRALRWEHILSQSRSGSVSEFMMCEWKKEWKKELETRLRASEEKLTNVTGRLNETESQLSTTVKELGAVRGELNSTEEKLDVVTSDLNKTESAMESVIGQLNSTQEKLNATQEELGTFKSELNSTQEELDSTQKELGTVKGELKRMDRELQTESAQHNRTGEQLDTCSTSLTNTLTQLETARTFKNISRWDVLYTTPFYKKVLTEELFQQLSSSWGMLGKRKLRLLNMPVYHS